MFVFECASVVFPITLPPAILASEVLATCRGGLAWDGHSDRGAARFDGKKTVVFSKADGLPDSEVKKVFNDSRGYTWLGTRDAGVARWLAGRTGGRPPGPGPRGWSIAIALWATMTSPPRVENGGLGALAVRRGTLRWSGLPNLADRLRPAQPILRAESHPPSPFHSDSGSSTRPRRRSIVDELVLDLAIRPPNAECRR
jgi:hypothetical protein